MGISRGGWPIKRLELLTIALMALMGSVAIAGVISFELAPDEGRSVREILMVLLGVLLVALAVTNRSLRKSSR